MCLRCKDTANLDALANNFQNLSNRANTFIGDLAGAIGQEWDNSLSEYATFETVNEKLVTYKMGGKPNVKAINWATANNCRWISIKDKNKGQGRYGGEARSYYN